MLRLDGVSSHPESAERDFALSRYALSSAIVRSLASLGMTNAQPLRSHPMSSRAAQTARDLTNTRTRKSPATPQQHLDLSDFLLLARAHLVNFGPCLTTLPGPAAGRPIRARAIGGTVFPEWILSRRSTRI